MENMESLRQARAEQEQLRYVQARADDSLRSAEQKAQDYQRLHEQLIDEASRSAAEHIVDREHHQLAISQLERAVAEGQEQLAQQACVRAELVADITAKSNTEHEMLAQLQAANVRLQNDLNECRRWLSDQTAALAAS